MPSPALLLASTSSYRRGLLDRLRLPFSVQAPGVDETPVPGESPLALSERLAVAKAMAVARTHPQAWVIGSDQVAECDGQALGKPGAQAPAQTQLRRLSGRRVQFHTALCLHRGASATTLRHVDLTVVSFRELDEGTIARYLDAERPYDCAGSFKSEGLGIALFDAIHSEDPTALVGLPLIALTRMLRSAGFVLP